MVPSAELFFLSYMLPTCFRVRGINQGSTDNAIRSNNRTGWPTSIFAFGRMAIMCVSPTLRMSSVHVELFFFGTTAESTENSSDSMGRHQNFGVSFLASLTDAH